MNTVHLNIARLLVYILMLVTLTPNVTLIIPEFSVAVAKKDLALLSAHPSVYLAQTSFLGLFPHLYWLELY